jgi:hypothetical protein
MSEQKIPSIFTLEDIKRVVDGGADFHLELIDRIKDGFVAFERGEFYAAPIQTLGLSPFPFVENVDGYAAQACVKSGYFKGQDHYVIKVASGGHPIQSTYEAQFAFLYWPHCVLPLFIIRSCPWRCYY